MNHLPNVVWVSASTSLKVFDRPLVQYLSQGLTIAQWQYEQQLDEASSLVKAVELLHDYLTSLEHAVHLVGHGMSGVVALLYARQYPERIKSLSLLSVAAQPAVTWHAHYYVQRQLLPCSRKQLLAQTVQTLFGVSLPFSIQSLISTLDRDLETSPTLHSLYQLVQLPQGGVSMPLLVCAAKDDSVVDRCAHARWSRLLKPGDRLWSCPSGRHFFHFFHPEQVGNQLRQFWQSASLNLPSLLIA
jgi:pimeloyl-ACP methyl ester carboxylesterase